MISVGILVVLLTIFLLVFFVYAFLGFVSLQGPVALFVIRTQLVPECYRDRIIVQSFDMPLSLLRFWMILWRRFFDTFQIGSALGDSHVLAGSSSERLEVIFARTRVSAIVGSAVHLAALSDVRRVDPVGVMALFTALKCDLGLFYLFDSFQVFTI